MSSENNYKKSYENWKKEFFSKLNTLEYHYEKIYLIHNDFFNISHEENANKKLNNISDEKLVEENFLVLDEKTWKQIKDIYPKEYEIEKNGLFGMYKFYFGINPYIYYFYFLNENNDIKEGYFIFKKHDFADKIIQILNNKNIYDFFNEMNIKMTNKIQSLYYDGQSYKIRLKEKKEFNNKSLNINNIIIDKDNKYENNYNNIYKKKIEQEKKNKKNNYFIPSISKEKEDDKNIILINDKISIKNNETKNKNNLLEDQENKYKKFDIYQRNGNEKNYIRNNNLSHKKDLKSKIIKNININKHQRSSSAKKISVPIKKEDIGFPFIPYDNVQFSLNHANGLENVGATCYMNATLQCLANIKNLTNYFLNPAKQQKILLNINKYKLTNAYLEVLKNLWKNNSIKFYSPHNFKNVISEMNSLFAGIQANDSKDLVLFLLETMHNELNKANKIN